MSTNNTNTNALKKNMQDLKARETKLFTSLDDLTTKVAEAVSKSKNLNVTKTQMTTLQSNYNKYKEIAKGMKEQYETHLDKIEEKIKQITSNLSSTSSSTETEQETGQETGHESSQTVGGYRRRSSYRKRSVRRRSPYRKSTTRRGGSRRRSANKKRKRSPRRRR